MAACHAPAAWTHTLTARFARVPGDRHWTVVGWNYFQGSRTYEKLVSRASTEASALNMCVAHDLRVIEQAEDENARRDRLTAYWAAKVAARQAAGRFQMELF